MSALTVEDFPSFFAAMHGHPPFLWQQRLLEEVVENKTWPRVIAAPTGAGKTAVLDIALFHLAMEAAKGEARAAPLRICFAVDRRIIVDQAYERAKVIRDTLNGASEPIIRRVADVLKQLSHDERPLHVEQLRGGLPREDDWARTPAQPTILCTTIDQLGSRLLFRGYGVSERMAPVHAGLLGEDCLILLDEAHLSRAFRETLDGVDRWRREGADAQARRPWCFSALTATPGAKEKQVFALTDEEKREENIRSRLEAEKRCELRSTGAAYSPEHAGAFVNAAEELSDTLAKAGAASLTIAIVVNRVPFARSIFEALKSEAKILLTGRVRPAERDDLIEEHASRLFSGRTRPDGAGPLFVVATQCIEAGADFDFDALVTQIAPLDALRQRFGRLNRLGADRPTPAVLIAAKDEIAKSAKPDPIYADRLKKTWDWLSAQAQDDCIDFGPSAMQALIEGDADAADKCIAEAKGAPILRGADLAFLSMTHPRPHPDPEITLFLHGELNRDTDVAIIWRADVEDCFNETENAEDRLERLGDVLDIAPPRPGEALRVPLWAAQRWMRRQSDARALADVDASSPPQEGSAAEPGRILARRIRGDDAGWEFGDASKIKPGDTLIAPSNYGGCDRYGWAPESEVDVDDIAENAAEPYQKRRAFLRLHERVWRDDSLSWSEIAARLKDGEASAKVLLEGAGGRAAHVLEHGGKLDVEWPYGEAEDGPRGAVIVARSGLRSAAPVDEAGQAVTDEGDAGSFMVKPVALSVHRVDVREMARKFAIAAGLPQRLAETVAFAALLHDDGKADSRFQAYLAGGALGDEILAKSARRRRGDDRAARTAANLPNAWRHEALSVRLAAAQFDCAPCADIDEELAVWLIGSHHGYGRPFFPHDDFWDDYARPILGGADLPAAPGPQRLDFEWRGMDWAQLFEALKRRYGVWGLAYFEAVVRLADHRASEMRERAG